MFIGLLNSPQLTNASSVTVESDNVAVTIENDGT